MSKCKKDNCGQWANSLGRFDGLCFAHRLEKQLENQNQRQKKSRKEKSNE